MTELLEELSERMAALLQPGIAESVERLIFGWRGGLAGPAVDLVGGNAATSGLQAGYVALHSSLDFITGLVLVHHRGHGGIEGLGDLGIDRSLALAVRCICLSRL